VAINPLFNSLSGFQVFLPARHQVARRPIKTAPILTGGLISLARGIFGARYVRWRTDFSKRIGKTSGVF